jgi:Cu/Ag efflux protein CusF
MRYLLTMMLLSLVVLACGSGDAPPADEAEPAQEATTAEESAEPQYFQGIGVIESIEWEPPSVTIAHEDIPGFMNAMTMSFEVLEAGQLETVEVGQTVDFVVVVKGDGSYYIERFGKMPQ